MDILLNAYVHRHIRLCTPYKRPGTKRRAGEEGVEGTERSRKRIRSGSQEEEVEWRRWRDGKAKGRGKLGKEEERQIG